MTLSIPYIGFPSQYSSCEAPATFNSLYWVPRLALSSIPHRYACFQFPILGSSDKNCECLLSNAYFQFPILGSIFFCCLAVARYYFQFPILGSKETAQHGNVSPRKLSIPYIGFSLSVVGLQAYSSFQFPILGSDGYSAKRVKVT